MKESKKVIHLCSILIELGYEFNSNDSSYSINNTRYYIGENMIMVLYRNGDERLFKTDKFYNEKKLELRYNKINNIKRNIETKATPLG